MEDDLASAGLHMLEELTSSRSFGRTGLHSVSERPSMRDRRATGVSTERKNRRTVTLRRDSLMNERTRSRRSYRAEGERPPPRSRHPMRKRKSDELSAIDLSELNDSSSCYDTREPEGSTPVAHSRNALDDLSDVFFGMDCQWRLPTTSSADTGRPPRPEVEADNFSHPLSGSGIFAKPKDPQRLDDCTVTAPSASIAAKAPPTPVSPAFLQPRTQSVSRNEGDSPCSVAAITRGCGACFWERSLAWSEDEDSDDDSIVHSRMIMRSGSITEHLSVPEHLGKEFAEAKTRISGPARSSRGGVPLRRPPTSRTVTLETDSRHKLPGAKMFRQTDVDKVTEIHWEEKVLDDSAIDLMAQLKL